MKTLNQQIKFYGQNPPGSLGAFRVRAINLPNIEFDGHNFSGSYPDGLSENPNIAFEVMCACGSKKHSLIAEGAIDRIIQTDGRLLAGRYHLRCSACGRRALLFDPAHSGYNAEVARTESLCFTFDQTEMSKESSVVESLAASCSRCGSHNFEIIVRFEYPGDLFDDPTFSGMEQQFYSWISVVGKCSKCSELSTLADYECA